MYSLYVTNAHVHGLYGLLTCHIANVNNNNNSSISKERIAQFIRETRLSLNNLSVNEDSLPVLQHTKDGFQFYKNEMFDGVECDDCKEKNCNASETQEEKEEKAYYKTKNYNCLKSIVKGFYCKKKFANPYVRYAQLYSDSVIQSNNLLTKRVRRYLLKHCTNVNKMNNYCRLRRFSIENVAFLKEFILKNCDRLEILLNNEEIVSL
ncbi:hypothetical protein [Lambdina fiscellaria nucleopolyhedrovirus]|uniref:Uncharacterized protein n=1 Tax=Lambdina fiscellaria nucleopolyhedrovirus TaxID=1642929 RepID=A0A0E3URS3_9ABAC|nr:hypothetical protein [Lambdina fiscellaria nucleopolyhedrovirus]AKC91729.1 hypothetical protein [Lambdina fiscellaria nucleopolyhedrovirus]